MPQLRETQATSDHLEKALECGCVALITLEATRARATGMTEDLQLVHDQINELIESVRAALDELRRARGQESSAVALGFVLGERGKPPITGS
jgi:hypothetical protein